MDEKQKRYSEWYDKYQNLYKEFCDEIEKIVTKLIEVNGIPVHSITSRVKDKNSYLKKCKTKEYEDATKDLMDFAGIRIIAYINSDVKSICKIIRKEFEIDDENSENKAEKLEVDQFGYLSHHFIAKLNEHRKKLTEHQNYRELKCEIQIRTLLQHAWAEIEHDKNYKFSGELPEHIKRRFYLIAGSLELLDREFQNISNDIEKYEKSVKVKTAKGEFDIAIDSTSLREYFSNSDYSMYYKTDIPKKLEKDLIDELNKFGINTLYQLNKLIPSNFKEILRDLNPKTHHVGIARLLMIIKDYKKFFETCSNSFKIGAKRIPEDIAQVLNVYGMSNQALEEMGCEIL